MKLEDVLGIKVEEVKEGYAKVSVMPKEEHVNFLGYVHGGLIFTLADAAFALASNSVSSPSVALQVNINYLSPPKIGELMTAEANLLKKGKTISVYTMEVRQGRRLIAFSQGTVYTTVASSNI